tara:strand:+ start:1112 stop:1501 length:390 start_codon:yes stop_codon:yes gene_type:complete
VIKSLALFIILIFVIIRCRSTTDKTVNELSVSGRWILDKTMDSYTNEWREKVNTIQFYFLDEGKFIRTDNALKICTGTYLVMNKTYIVNHDCNTSELRYKLENLSIDSLQISTVGRHGKVYYQFHKQKP